MTDITAEVVGPVDRPPVPTETPEVWILGRWHWMSSKRWTFIVHGVGRDTKHEMENSALPGDILIRIPASGGGK